VNAIKLWDPDTGRLIGNLVGHKDQVVALAFSPDGRRIISASIDRIIRIWDANNGSTLGTTIVARNGEWITVTPEGFFRASANGAQMLNVVRGLDVYSIALFYQSLYRPDLVREKLSGDIQGRVKAAAKLDLARVRGSNRLFGSLCLCSSNLATQNNAGTTRTCRAPRWQLGETSGGGMGVEVSGISL
jgi:WD40 repeat protein